MLIIQKSYLIYCMEVLKVNLLYGIHPQAIDLLEGLIPSSDDGSSKDVSNDHLQRLIIFAIMFSLGALLELDDRKKVKLFHFFL